MNKEEAKIIAQKAIDDLFNSLQPILKKGHSDIYKKALISIAKTANSLYGINSIIETKYIRN